jgi:catechol 2,3-dioxygenase-like lactoylglutathione lyase family enzyme
MIKGMHGLFFTPKAEEARDFLKDKLGLPFVDGGGGWLIFGIPMAEAAVHPADETRHEISFWCDDIETTVAELRDRGSLQVADRGGALGPHHHDGDARRRRHPALRAQASAAQRLKPPAPAARRTPAARSDLQ